MTDPTIPPGPPPYDLPPGQDQWATYRQQFTPPRRNRRRPLLIALVVAAVAIIAAGIAAVAASSGGKQLAVTHPTTTAAPTTYSTPVTITDDAAPATTTEAPADNGPLAFGETGQWEDGMKAVVVSAVKASFDVTSTNPGPGIKVTVKVTNGTTDPVDLFPDAALRLGAEGTTTEMVYGDGCDSLSDLGRLVPKRSVTAQLCFTGRSGQVDVSFAPDGEHEAQTWTGKVR